MKTTNTTSGFTLIEIILVMAVIGIMTAMVLPSYFASQRSAALIQAGNDTVNKIENVRSRAIAGEVIDSDLTNDPATINDKISPEGYGLSFFLQPTLQVGESRSVIITYAEKLQNDLIHGGDAWGWSGGTRDVILDDMDSEVFTCNNNNADPTTQGCHFMAPYVVGHRLYQFPGGVRVADIVGKTKEGELKRFVVGSAVFAPSTGKVFLVGIYEEGKYLPPVEDAKQSLDLEWLRITLAPEDPVGLSAIGANPNLADFSQRHIVIMKVRDYPFVCPGDGDSGTFDIFGEDPCDSTQVVSSWPAVSIAP